MITSGSIHLFGIAHRPVHQGGFRRAGNTTLQMTDEIVVPGGRMAHVPIVSGQSVKGQIRRAIARHALDTMGLRGTLTAKSQVDLAFSGGHLSGGGSKIDLDLIRCVRALLPAVSVVGYSSGNVMQRSRVETEPWDVACTENLFRMSAQARAFYERVHGSETDFPSAASLLVKCSGTRRDEGKDQGEPYLDEAVNVGDSDADDDEKSSQMIYEYYAIAAGSILYTTLSWLDLSELERQALVCGLAGMTREVLDAGSGPCRLLWAIAAKSSIGRSLVAVEFAPKSGDGDWLANAVVSVARGDLSPVSGYLEHLRENRTAVVELLQRMP